MVATVMFYASHFQIPIRHELLGYFFVLNKNASVAYGHGRNISF